MKQSYQLKPNFLSAKRKVVITTPQSNESAIPTARSVTSLKQEDLKKVVKTEEKEQDSRLKNWNNVFGDFLSEDLLRKRKQAFRQKTQIPIDKAYFKEVPFNTISTLYQSPSTRRNFAKFIQGQITASDFIALKNRGDLLDRLKTKQEQQDKKQKVNLDRFEKVMFNYRRQALTEHDTNQSHFLQFLSNKSQEIYRKARVKERFGVIRDLIEAKVQKRKEEDLKKTSREIKGVGVFKQMYDISDIYIQNLMRMQQEKRIQMEKKEVLSGQTVRIVKHQNPYLQAKTATYKNEKKNKCEQVIGIPVMKHLIRNKAKQYLDDLAVKNYCETERVKKRIYVDYQFKKAIENENNQKGFFKNQYINNELELIQFIHDYQKSNPFKDKQQQDRVIKELLNINIDEKQQLEQKVKYKYQTKLRVNTDASSQASLSCNDSLFSMYEFNLDNLYNQSKQLQQKLVERQYTDGFTKTIRSIQKNEQLKQEIVERNLEKLNGGSPLQN